jgi:hypothetical protein
VALFLNDDVGPAPGVRVSTYLAMPIYVLCMLSSYVVVRDMQHEQQAPVSKAVSQCGTVLQCHTHNLPDNLPMILHVSTCSFE